MRLLTLYALLKLFIIGVTLCRAQQLRRSLLFVHETSDAVDCLYSRSDVQYEGGESEESDACVVEDVVYNIPVGLLSNYSNQLQSGKTRVHIEGARLQPSGGIHQANVVVLTRRAPNITLSQDVQHSSRRHGFLTAQYVKVVAVRVMSNDSNVTLSRQEISDTMFGAAQNVTLASQLHKCSAGAFTIVPGVVGGVAELNINVNTIGVSSKNLETTLRTRFAEVIGSEEDYGHILFCLPKGCSGPRSTSNNWVAYAYRHTKLSFYNDEWCGSLTSKMHELAHNLNKGHSGETDPNGGGLSHYEDRTCVMGVSYRKRDGPKECYNGWRHWTFGWYARHHVTVTPPLDRAWGGNLIAFVDYKDIRDGDYVIINVYDLYVQYNLADKHNKEVMEKRNQVTIVKAGRTEEDVSEMLVGLDMQNSTFEDNTNVVIELCEPGTYNGVRYFRMSIHHPGQTSACIEVSEAPSMSLAPSISQAPSASPSSSALPSREPSQSPMPSQSLTTAPSMSPSANLNKDQDPNTQGCIYLRPGVLDCS